MQFPVCSKSRGRYRWPDGASNCLCITSARIGEESRFCCLEFCSDMGLRLAALREPAAFEALRTKHGPEARVTLSVHPICANPNASPICDFNASFRYLCSVNLRLGS